LVAEFFEAGTHFADICARFQRHAFNRIHPNLDSLKSLFDGCKSRIQLFADWYGWKLSTIERAARLSDHLPARSRPIDAGVLKFSLEVGAR
jgi:hypothetical protein